MKHRSWTVISGRATLALTIWLGLAGSVSAQSVSYSILCRGFFNANNAWVNFADQVADAAPVSPNPVDLNLPSPPFFATGGSTTFVPELLQGTLTFPGPLKANSSTTNTVTFNANIGGIWMAGNTASGKLFVHKVPGGYSFDWTYATGPFFDLFGPAKVTFNGVDVADPFPGGPLTTLHFQQNGDDDSSGANIHLSVPNVNRLYRPQAAGVTSSTYGITTGTLECDGYLN